MREEIVTCVIQLFQQKRTKIITFHEFMKERNIIDVVYPFVIQHSKQKRAGVNTFYQCMNGKNYTGVISVRKSLWEHII